MEKKKKKKKKIIGKTLLFPRVIIWILLIYTIRYKILALCIHCDWIKIILIIDQNIWEKIDFSVKKETDKETHRLYCFLTIHLGTIHHLSLFIPASFMVNIFVICINLKTIIKVIYTIIIYNIQAIYIFYIIIFIVIIIYNLQFTT